MMVIFGEHLQNFDGTLWLLRTRDKKTGLNSKEDELPNGHAASEPPKSPPCENVQAVKVIMPKAS
jgi:hypothetical protein